MTTPDCTLAPGALLEPLHIVDLTVEGGAVARHDGRVVFLDAGLPGESVQAEVTAVRKKIIEARRVRTLEPSPLAVQAWCPHAGDCGGCTLQELSPEGRLAWKENHVRQTLARIGKMQGLPVAPIIAAPKERGGRIRVAYAFGFDADGTFTLGLHRRASHEIVAVEECGLQRPEAGVILRRMRDALAGLKLPGGARPGDYLRRFIIHTPDYAPDGEPVIVAECLVTPERRPGDHKVLWGLLHGVLGEDVRLLLSEARDPKASRAERIAKGGPIGFQESYGGTILEFPVTAFAQTNTGAAELLYGLTAEKAGLTGTETVWDLYCGSGSIALLLAPKAAKVFGCDGLRTAVDAARANAVRLGLENCEFAAGDMSELIASRAQQETPDVIVLDPPRTGLEAGVREFLKTTGARRLLYVACDVASQARDVAELAGTWRAVSAHPLDMFPTATHVENLLVLERV